MAHGLWVSRLLLGASLAAFGPVLAQVPPAAPTAPATSPPPATPAAPSADTLKKARLAGYRPETKNGITMYCQATANIGTRFPTKKCLDEQQLKSVVDIQHQQQDSLRKPPSCSAGGACGAS